VLRALFREHEPNDVFMSCESKGRLSGTSVAFQHLLDKPAAWRSHLQLSTHAVPHWTAWADDAPSEGQLTVNERRPFNTLFAGLCMDIISQPRSENSLKLYVV
jgi:hypothetical protein